VQSDLFSCRLVTPTFQPRLSSVLSKFSHIFLLHSGVTPWIVLHGPVRPRLPSDATVPLSKVYQRWNPKHNLKYWLRYRLPSCSFYAGEKCPRFGLKFRPQLPESSALEKNTAAQLWNVRQTWRPLLCSSQMWSSLVLRL